MSKKMKGGMNASMFCVKLFFFFLGTKCGTRHHTNSWKREWLKKFLFYNRLVFVAFVFNSPICRPRRQKCCFFILVVDTSASLFLFSYLSLSFHLFISLFLTHTLSFFSFSVGEKTEEFSLLSLIPFDSLCWCISFSLAGNQSRQKEA